MKRSVSRILTTHVGSLPRPNDLLELHRDNAPDGTLLPRLQSAIADVVRRQTDCGVDVVNDGEFGKAMRRAVDYGAWWSYVYDRLAGFELRQAVAERGRGAWTFGSKERKEFAEFYAEDGGMGSAQAGSSSARMYGLTCTGPVKYVGHAAIKRDIDNLKGALAGARAEDAFMTAVSPATLQILPNEYYKNREDLPGPWRRRSTRNTRPLLMQGSSSRSMIRRWLISTIGGSPLTATWLATASGPLSRSRP